MAVIFKFNLCVFVLPLALAFNAEAGVKSCGSIASASLSRVEPMKLVQDATSPTGSYVEISRSLPRGGVGSAKFTVDVTRAGTFKLFATLMTMDENSDSFYIRIDGGKKRTWHAYTATENKKWRTTSYPHTFELPAGRHTIELIGRERGTRLAGAELVSLDGSGDCVEDSDGNPDTEEQDTDPVDDGGHGGSVPLCQLQGTCGGSSGSSTSTSSSSTSSSTSSGSSSSSGASSSTSSGSTSSSTSSGSSGGSRDNAPWAGINPIHGGQLANSQILSNSLRGIRELGLRMARVGVDHPLDRQEQIFNSFLSQGVTIHAVLPMGGRSPEQYRSFANATMQRFKGKVSYYIVGNEPNLNDYTPEQAVEYTRIAYEESRKVAPDGSIRVESSPTSSPGTKYLKSMIDLGVTRYADLVGVHSYGTQINDKHSLGISRPWEYMAEANRAKGYPIKPVASSENGTATGYAPAGLDGRLYQARWFYQNYVQHKRFGYDNILLYALDSSYPGEQYDIATMCGTDLCRRQPTFDAVKLIYQERPFANGGFERPNNRELDWVVVFDTGQVNPVEWSRVSFPAGDAKEGNVALRAVAPVKVRRVANFITPGQAATITAWVKVDNGATAKLKAQGYNHLNGAAEVVAESAGTNGGWRQLTLSVTPSNPWVVISLETEGRGTVLWDGVTLNGRTD